MPSTAVICCCSKVKGAGVAGTGVDAGGVEGPATALDVAAAVTGAAVAGEGGLAGVKELDKGDGPGPGRERFEFVAGCCWYTVAPPGRAKPP